MNDVNLILLKKKIKVLRAYKGQGTQLISLYLPPDADRSSVTKQLTDEMSQSSNIKSAQTRKNVQTALKRIINYLKVIDFKLPETGLVLFSGDVSTNPSKSDVVLLIIVPPTRLTTKLYWCDSSFHIIPLEDMAQTDEVYGLVVLDKREATLAILRGKTKEILSRETSGVPGKSRAGGQSALRFERVREKAAEEFYKRVGTKINMAYVGIENFKGLVIGGPGLTKHQFLEIADIDHRIKNKILGTVDTSYTDESGIKEILDKSEDILKEASIIQERKIVNKFFEDLAKNSLGIYGFKDVIDALDLGKVSTVLVSDGLDWTILKFKCISDKTNFIKVVKNKYELSGAISKFESGSIECNNQKAELLEELDIFDYFLEIAENTSSKVELISVETLEGKQFFDTFGGLGAFLRYK
jgi:peptide chain release factor subunit 1